MKRIALLPVALLMASFYACGGGGGGGESANNNTSPAANVTGAWGGIYESNIDRYYYDHNYYKVSNGIFLNMQRTNNVISGAFKTDTNISGNLSGSIYDNNINISLVSTDPSCIGQYSGTGTVTNDNYIEFRYSGSDCLGTYTNKYGKLFKLINVATNKWSGNWWGNPLIDDYTIISLNTNDNVNFNGNLISVNRVDKSVLTADLNGVWGIPSVNNMDMTGSNIIGNRYIGEPQITSIAVGIDGSDTTPNPVLGVGLSGTINGGGWSGHDWFQKLN